MTSDMKARRRSAALLSFDSTSENVAELAAQARLIDSLYEAFPSVRESLVNEPANWFEAAEALKTFCAERRPDELAILMFRGQAVLWRNGEISVAVSGRDALSAATLRAALNSCRAERQLVILTGGFRFERDPGDDAQPVMIAALDKEFGASAYRAVLAAPLADRASDAFALRLASVLEEGAESAKELAVKAEALVLGNAAWDAEAPPPGAAAAPAPPPEAPPRADRRRSVSLPEMLAKRRQEAASGQPSWGRRANRRSPPPPAEASASLDAMLEAAPEREPKSKPEPEPEPVAAPGKLHAEIPRRMRVAKPRIVAAALTKDLAAKASALLADAAPADLSSHDVRVAGVMGVALGDPEDAFEIKPLSQPLQPLDGAALKAAGFAEDGPVGLWRWRVTPKRSGRYPLTLDAVAYIPSGGALIPAPAQNEQIAVRVGVNAGLALRGAARWVLIGALGVAVFDLGVQPLMADPTPLFDAFDWIAEQISRLTADAAEG